MNIKNLTAGFVCSFLALIPVVLCFLNNNHLNISGENETSPLSHAATPRHFPHEIYTLDANITGSPLPKLLRHETVTDVGNSTGSPLARNIHDELKTESINSTESPLMRNFPDFHLNSSTESANNTVPPMSRSAHFQNSSNDNFLNGSSIMARQGFGVWRNCPACGILQRNRIVGGRQATITEFPWTVSIRKGGVQHCGASIINRNYLLTAAHCIRGHDINKMEAIAAVTDVLDQRAFRTRISGYKIHEHFEPTIYDYDVAILRVSEPFPLNKGVKAVCLPDPQDDPAGQRAIVSGWGALRETDTVASDYLSKLEVPVVNNERCAQAPGMRTQVITPRMLCAGFLDGSKDACIGDSGGPLVWNVRGQWKQVGIVSWGIGCARPGFYGIYSRVSMLLPWIAANTADGQC